ncbi:MAG: hypothetical protein V4732_11350 [Pseudomonadota bacterium]
MHYVKLFLFSAVLLMSGGCASQNCKPVKGAVLPGTDTAIVGLYLDKEGFPQSSVDPVTVRPGQKIIFAGPDKFEIFFKDPKSFIGKVEYRSENGIVIIEVPRDIFEQARKEGKSTSGAIKELLYRYGIRANGKVTDPTIHVIRS